MWPFRVSKKSVAPEFRGAPAVRRIKHYAAENGHTYRYFYCGWRLNGSDATEYMFECRRDTSAPETVRVILSRENLDACAAQIGRNLLSSEQYAIVKLALFRSFDSSNDALSEAPIVPSSGEMIELLQQLGRM